MPLTIREQLKAGTLEIHQQLEQAYPLSALQQNTCCDVSDRVVTIFNHWHGQVNNVLAFCLPDELFKQFRQDDLPAGLSRDILSTTTDELHSVSDQLSYGIGWLYVILGSSMGARVILQQVQTQPHHSDCRIVPYYQYMAAKQEQWQDFQVQLAELEKSGQLVPDISIKGALAAFRSLLDLCNEYGATEPSCPAS